MTHIKICGLRRAEDAHNAVKLGATALGFVLYADSKRHIDLPDAESIIKTLPPFVTTVAVLVNPSPSLVNNIKKQALFNMLQYHGGETAEFCHEMGYPYIKALRATHKLDIFETAEKYRDARAILLDAYHEDDLGGTGKTFDWDLAKIKLTKPLILAGGLTADNVGSAIKSVSPYAVDVSTGVESKPGVKDCHKLQLFIDNVREASA